MRPVELQFESISISVIDSLVTWCNLTLNISSVKRPRGEFCSNIFTHFCSAKIFSYLYDQHKPFQYSWGSNNNYCREEVVNGWWTSGVPPPTVRFKRRLEAKSVKIMKQSVIIWELHVARLCREGSTLMRYCAVSVGMATVSRWAPSDSGSNE